MTERPLPPPGTSARTAATTGRPPTGDGAGFPPPIAPGGGEPASEPSRLRHPAALVATAAALGIVAAIVAGLSIGSLVMAAANSDCSATDTWCELGGALFGLVAGAGVAGIAYIAAGVATIRRCRRAGERARYVVAHLAVPWTFVVAATILSALSDALV